MKKFSQKQIVEAIAHWKRVLEKIDQKESLDESEDMIDNNYGILRCSARDLLYKDSEKLGDDVEVEEVYLSKFGGRDLLPVSLSEKELYSLKKLTSNSSDTYRAMAYILKRRVVDDSRWTYANDKISGEHDYDDYVDPESSLNKRYPDEYDKEFAKAFPTYESWKSYSDACSIKKLQKILKNSEDLCYSSAADEVKVDKYGNIYTLIVWRA